jgi:hypothetical protein
MGNYQDDRYLTFLIVIQDLQQVFGRFQEKYILQMNRCIPLMNKDDNLKGGRFRKIDRRKKRTYNDQALFDQHDQFVD